MQKNPWRIVESEKCRDSFDRDEKLIMPGEFPNKCSLMCENLKCVPDESDIGSGNQNPAVPFQN